MPCLKAGRQRMKLTSTALSRSSKILKVGILADLFNNSPTLPIESVAQMQVSYCHRMNDHDHDLLKGQKTKKSSQGNPALMATQQSGRQGQHLLPWHSWQPWLMIKFVDKILCNHLYIVHYCFTLSLYIERCTLSLHIVIAHCLYNVFFAITMFSSVVPFDFGIYFRGPALKKQTL